MLKLIMIDECWDEVVVDTFMLGDDLDEDYLEVWEDMKINKARQRFPEANGFYFEDTRALQRMVWDELREDDDDDIDEWGEMVE